MQGAAQHIEKPRVKAAQPPPAFVHVPGSQGSVSGPAVHVRADPDGLYRIPPAPAVGTSVRRPGPSRSFRYPTRGSAVSATGSGSSSSYPSVLPGPPLKREPALAVLHEHLGENVSFDVLSSGEEDNFNVAEALSITRGENTGALISNDESVGGEGTLVEDDDGAATEVDPSSDEQADVPDARVMSDIPEADGAAEVEDSQETIKLEEDDSPRHRRWQNATWQSRAQRVRRIDLTEPSPQKVARRSS